MTNRRNRTAYFWILMATVVAGLCSRRFSYMLPDFINTYLGDALWALMIFILVRILLPRLDTLRTGLLTTTFCFLIESSQLYHEPWIDAIRATKLGGLVLGFGFLWSDLVAYVLGVCAGMLAEKAVEAAMREKLK